MKQGALQEDCLNATLELTVFKGFQKGGMSKSLFEAIGRMQVVRGIQKKKFRHVECARPRALSVPLCNSFTHIESCSFASAPFLLHATCDVKSSSQIGLKTSVQVAECARPRALSLLK